MIVDLEVGLRLAFQQLNDMNARVTAMEQVHRDMRDLVAWARPLRQRVRQLLEAILALFS